ncbi:hypothetical protein [Enterobacter mori]|uniref:hypothetical protein n=1 Tax=Enterobacter mori TaxID=539813 RepID=UPI002A7FB48F|nr:hypothetical protein [Enterobacter mori]
MKFMMSSSALITMLLSYNALAVPAPNGATVAEAVIASFKNPSVTSLNLTASTELTAGTVPGDTILATAVVTPMPLNYAAIKFTNVAEVNSAAMGPAVADITDGATTNPKKLRVRLISDDTTTASDSNYVYNAVQGKATTFYVKTYAANTIAAADYKVALTAVSYTP